MRRRTKSLLVITALAGLVAGVMLVGMFAVIPFIAGVMIGVTR